MNLPSKNSYNKIKKYLLHMLPLKSSLVKKTQQPTTETKGYQALIPLVRKLSSETTSYTNLEKRVMQKIYRSLQ